MPMCRLKNAFVLAATGLLNSVFYVLYDLSFIAFFFYGCVIDPLSQNI